MDGSEENLDQAQQLEAEEDETTDSEQSLIAIQIAQKDFYEDTLVVALVEIHGVRQVFVPLRQFCENLGVDWSSQRQRLARDEVLAAEMVSVTVPTDQLHKRGYYNRPVVCLPLEILPGWLFNISPSRVRPELREKVQRYRRSCYRALWHAFQRGELFPANESSVVEAVITSTEIQAHDPRIAALDEQIETLSVVVALLQEHRAALLAERDDTMMTVVTGQQELLARTDMISSQLDYVVALLETLVGRQELTEIKITKIDERTTHLTPAHAKYVRDLVDRIVQAIDRLSPGSTLNYARVYAQIYGRFKRYFNVAKYDQVADERFEEVKAWLQQELRKINSGNDPEQGTLL